MKLRLKESPREWTRFALVLLTLFSALSALAWWQGLISLKTWMMILGVFAGGFGALMGHARWRRALYRGGMTACFHMGQFMGRVLLFFFYLGALCPMALLLRVLGKKPLDLAMRRSAQTYWQPARPPTALERLF
jgi:hypothetical protein